MDRVGPVMAAVVAEIGIVQAVVVMVGIVVALMWIVVFVVVVFVVVVASIDGSTRHRGFHVLSGRDAATLTNPIFFLVHRMLPLNFAVPRESHNIYKF